jgi:hypothetical protein
MGNHARARAILPELCSALHVIADDSHLRALVASADPLPLVDAALSCAHSSEPNLRTLASRLRWAGRPLAGELVAVDHDGAASCGRGRRGRGEGARTGWNCAARARGHAAQRGRRAARVARTLARLGSLHHYHDRYIMLVRSRSWSPQRAGTCSLSLSALRCRVGL